MKRFVRFGLALMLGAFLAVPSIAAAAQWNIDPAHSTVTFKVRHLMVTWVRGEFQKVRGKVVFDKKNPQSAKADVTIDASSINTRNERRDNHLRNDDFLLVEKHPNITFKSKSVKNIRTDGFDLVGDLTIRGTTKEVSLKVAEISGPITDNRGRVKLGASATTKINRKNFGVKYARLIETGGVVVGDDVFITLDVQLIQGE